MKIKELLDTPDKWTQGTCARDTDGDATYSESPTAVCFCLLGAINKCYPIDEDNGANYEVKDKVKAKVIELSGYSSIANWNDVLERKFSDVKKLVEELDI